MSTPYKCKSCAHEYFHANEDAYWKDVSIEITDTETHKGIVTFSRQESEISIFCKKCNSQISPDNIAGLDFYFE